jgi:hypothetical protein
VIHITYIYLVTNCYNDPNKVYIGKTKNSRKSGHKRKFGHQIEYSEIDEINSLDRKNWKPIETYWINQFKAWGFDVLNENEGGGGPITHSEEVKQKMKRSIVYKTLDKAKELRQQGYSYQYIADVVGDRWDNVRNALKDIPKTNSQPYNRPTSDKIQSKKEEIIRLRQQGFTYQKIAKSVNLNLEAVWRVVNNNK